MPSRSLALLLTAPLVLALGCGGGSGSGSPSGSGGSGSASTGSGGGAPDVLVQGTMDAEPIAIAIQGSTLFTIVDAPFSSTNDSELLRTDLASRATTHIGSFPGAAGKLAADAERAFVVSAKTSARALEAFPKMGGKPVTLSDASLDVLALAGAASGRVAFFADRYQPSPLPGWRTVPAGGGTTELVASVPATEEPAGTVVDGDLVFYDSGAARPGIFKVPIGGGAAAPIADASDVAVIAPDADHFYFIELTGGSTGSIRRVARAGGKVEELWSGNLSPLLGVTDKFVYFFGNGASSAAVQRFEKANPQKAPEEVMSLEMPPSQILGDGPEAYAIVQPRVHDPSTDQVHYDGVVVRFAD